GLTASAGAASGQVDLEWNPSTGAENYTIYYSSDGGNTFTPISPNVTGTSYPHTGLNDGTEYTYYVVANNAGGASADSSEVSAKPIDTVQGKLTLRFQDADSAIVSESGTTDTLTLKLQTAPTGDVNVEVTSKDTGELTASPAQLTFTPSNWDVDQIITVTGIADSTVDGDQTVEVHVKSSSTDAMYDELSQHKPVTVTDIDTDEPDYPVITLSPGEQQIKIEWAPVAGAVSYNLNWSSISGPSGEINSVSAQQVVDGANPLVFVHAPLVAGVNHTYIIEAVDAEGNILVSAPKTASALQLSCPVRDMTLNQSQNLLAYYSFDGNLEDSAGDFDLTATGDSIVYGDGCANGTSGYFDGDGGYAYNLDFNDGNVSEVADGSWTITFWVNADEDMNKFASMISTTSVPEEGWGKGFQIDVTSDMRPRFFACKKAVDCAEEANTETFDTTMTAPKDKALQLGEWTHIAVTMDDQTAVMYINGEEVVSQSGLVTEFNRLKVGLNRWEQQPWKGYLDELMIFGDVLTADDILSIYNNVLPAPSNLAGTTPASTQQVNLTWTKSNTNLALNYVIYWKKDSGSTISFDPNDNTTYDGMITLGSNSNSYVHSGLDGNTQYNYVIRAENSIVGVSTYEPSVNSYSITTNSFPKVPAPTPDPDPDLLVYYEFDGDLTDTRRKYDDSRYDLTAVEGATITYADSRFSGNTAAYFDASNGYAYTENLNDAAENDLFASRSFTVSVWFYADPDMPDYSSLMSSRYVPEFGNDGSNWSWQLDSNNNKLRWRAATGEQNDTEETAPNEYPTAEWSHATFVKHSDGTIEIYLNGSLIHTGLQNNTPLDVLKIGTNRREEKPWKGYIDEFKIYSRALTAIEVTSLYSKGTPRTSSTSEVEPVYVDTKVGFHYSVDYVRNASHSYNPPSYNSKQYKVNEPNMASFTRLYVAAGDKIKEHGMHINQYKTTITIDDVTSVDYKRQIDVVDKNGGWSYFNYYIIVMDQSEFNNFAIRTNRMECFGQTFNTIAEYTACNPEWIQNQKDLWDRQGDEGKTKLLNDFIPVKDGYYTIEVKKYRGSQHYNYAKYDGVRNYTIVTQQ
ncbi:MAG TPA: hypothetical protein DIT98_01240, partial [Verrucomicrobiales bacterium]|nr:hypothetical protein [Verrucomicrobiales bacterium]